MEVVIVGAGAVGMKTASRIRRKDPEDAQKILKIVKEGA